MLGAAAAGDAQPRGLGGGTRPRSRGERKGRWKVIAGGGPGTISRRNSSLSFLSPRGSGPRVKNRISARRERRAGGAIPHPQPRRGAERGGKRSSEPRKKKKRGGGGEKKKKKKRFCHLWLRCLLAGAAPGIRGSCAEHGASPAAEKNEITDDSGRLFQKRRRV